MATFRVFALRLSADQATDGLPLWADLGVLELDADAEGNPTPDSLAPHGDGEYLALPEAYAVLHYTTPPED